MRIHKEPKITADKRYELPREKIKDTGDAVQIFILKRHIWCEALSYSFKNQVALQGKIQGSNISHGTCYVFSEL